MRYYWILFQNEMRKIYCTAIRYKFNTLFSALFWAALMIFLSYHLAEGGRPSKIIYTFVSSFMIWQIVNFTFISVVDSIISESVQGTLEQLYINSRSFYGILFIKGFSAALLSIIQSLISILLTIALVPQLDIHFLLYWVHSLPLLIIGLPALIGLGIACASLALKHKNISSFYSMVSSIFFAVITYNAKGLAGNVTFSLLLPFGEVNSSIQYVFSTLNSFIPIFTYIYAFINSIIYIIIGYVFLRYYEKASKKEGLFSKF